jgi:hypothetical protein
VRAKLEDDEVFPTVPPIAVALWERHLAYGAALGLAAGAVRPIPMGAESDRRAWSSYGGRWRQVRVKYPHFVPLAWGLHPLSALVAGVVAAGVPAAGTLYFLSSLAPPIEARDAGAAELIVVAAIFLVPALLALGGLTVVARSVADLWSSTEVRGEVVRLRAFGSSDQKRHYVAIDDGKSATLRAWQVRPELYSPLAQYQVVTASVTPRLGYVRSITPVSSS